MSKRKLILSAKEIIGQGRWDKAVRHAIAAYAESSFSEGSNSIEANIEFALRRECTPYEWARVLDGGTDDKQHMDPPAESSSRFITFPGAKLSFLIAIDDIRRVQIRCPHGFPDGSTIVTNHGDIDVEASCDHIIAALRGINMIGIKVF